MNFNELTEGFQIMNSNEFTKNYYFSQDDHDFYYEWHLKKVQAHCAPAPLGLTSVGVGSRIFPAICLVSVTLLFERREDVSQSNSVNIQEFSD